jgi:hypothetical protein
MQPRRPSTRLEVTGDDVQRILNLSAEDIQSLQRGSAKQQKSQKKSHSLYDKSQSGGNGNGIEEEEDHYNNDGFHKRLERQAMASKAERIGTIRTTYNNSKP